MRWTGAGAWHDVESWAIMGFNCSELNEVKGDWVEAEAIEEPNDSERFISGGERSEETVRRLLGGVWNGEFAMA